MMEAHAYKQVDESFRIHQLAWAITVAGGRKKNGSPAYKKFTQFYNYGKAIKGVEREVKKQEAPAEDRFAGVREVIRKQMRRNEE